mmetsp:Transcript_14862/g.21925  ORF Transcript_14862/g.21925 Transcript_14862/m.21925 type:complete len:255 (+) Transcript_14862:264-1028(+)|eukprot:CAMPEP_0194204930 /NCGR_PEP_ID=MMETSP0156-20130528/4328_1 /TAXON_ID=33649 /ORGANISM="Thalassionema nitzschioides, Strain L26-B" /LENGTH=254 /DNA_ID=CAMNT_0038931075 /DNA_START=242 /DNA_END=1006 /DNA_ORIENTATION=-
MKIYYALITPFLSTSFFMGGLVQGATPVGTIDNCCCGPNKIEGSCCKILDCTDNGDGSFSISSDTGSGIDCAYTGFVQGNAGDCPAGAFDCPSTIVCPGAAAPTEPAPTPTEPAPTPTAPAPTPTGDTPPVPPKGTSCEDVPGFVGAVDSDPKCKQACESFGIYCVGDEFNSECGYVFKTSNINNGETTSTSCTCGPDSFPQQICADKSTSPTATPPTDGPPTATLSTGGTSSAPQHPVFVGVGVLVVAFTLLM